MTINDAIKTLVDWDILSAHEVDVGLRKSVLLGIQALKRIKNVREANPHLNINRLPGETFSK